MRCPEWWLLQVHSRAPGSSIEAGSRICLRNSREIILQLIILLHVYYTRHFLHWHLPYFPLWDSRAPHEWCHVTHPLSDYCLGELYSARIVNRSIGCGHPGTWCILVSDQSSSCLAGYYTTFCFVLLISLSVFGHQPLGGRGDGRSPHPSWFVNFRS